MIRNNDPEIVVIERGIANSLIHYARIGAMEAGADISDLERHVRKFNTPVSDAHQEEINRARQQFRADRKAVTDLIRTNLGKTVFVVTDKYVLTPMRFLSRTAGSKTHVRVHDPRSERVIDGVPIGGVFAELPEGYRIHEIGRWKGCFVHNEKTI
jgi:hypothetical protein